jgi:hypothetical protein
MLYDPDDRMIGVFGVPAGGRLGIPIRGGGAYVAVAENGTAEIGADRTPADPDLHPLATVTGDYPSRPPGRDGGYGEADEEVGQPGVPFGFEAVVLHDPFAPFSLCYDEAPSRLLQGNRTIGYGGGVGDGWDGWASASVYLDGTALTVHGGGFGDDGCARPGVRVTSYVRP